MASGSSTAWVRSCLTCRRKRTTKGRVDEAYGAYQRGYYRTAMDKALPRAQLGDPAAQTLVAEMLALGLGVKRDPEECGLLVRQGGGRRRCGGDVQICADADRGQVRQARQGEGRRVHAQVRRTPAIASAQFNWAQILTADNPGDKGLKLALPYYEKSAEQGVADAQYAVARDLFGACLICRRKRSQLAREWMARAAHAGFDTAQVDLGVWLVNGHERAARFRAAASNGCGLPPTAATWLRRTSSRISTSMRSATKPDPVEAAKWYVLSRRAGLPDPALEDFYLGIEDDQQKAAIDAANKFRRTARSS